MPLPLDAIAGLDVDADAEPSEEEDGEWPLCFTL